MQIEQSQALFRLVPGVGVAAEIVGAGFGHVDFEVFCGGFEVGEGLFAVGFRDVFDLVEAGDGVADVAGVGHGLLALFGEGEGGVGEVLFVLAVAGFVVVRMPCGFHTRVS